MTHPAQVGLFDDMFSPEAIQQQADLVNLMVDDMARAVAAEPRVVQTEASQDFARFAVDWKTFYQGLTGSWWQRAFNSTRDRLRSYVTTVTDWRAKFLAMGLKLPDVKVKKPGALPWWGKAAIGAGVLGAGYLVWRAVTGPRTVTFEARE